MSAAADAQKTLIFVGSYAEASDSGVYVYAFDEGNEQFTLLDQAKGFKNPTFLNLDIPGLKLYSIAEGVSQDGGKTGEAVAFSIDAAVGTLKELNRSTTVAAPTCHIQRSADDRYLVVSSYHGGMVGLVSLTGDGRIGKLLDVKQHEGRGANPERQNEPHPHSAFFSPDQRFVFISDLGIDRIRAYVIDPVKGELRFHGDTATHPGAGPRHLAFHPNGRLAFVINEVDSTVTSFVYDAEAGNLEPVQTVSTLPDDFQGENTCAEIAVSTDGRYLYGSNRGHDSIVAYAIDAKTGVLTQIEHVSVEGRHPRHFSLTPGGRYLIAANRDTDNLTLFRVDQATGRLQFTGRSVEVSKPVCVWAANFPPA